MVRELGRYVLFSRPYQRNRIKTEFSWKSANFTQFQQKRATGCWWLEKRPVAIFVLRTSWVCGTLGPRFSTLWHRPATTDKVRPQWMVDFISFHRRECANRVNWYAEVTLFLYKIKYIQICKITSSCSLMLMMNRLLDNKWTSRNGAMYLKFMRVWFCNNI